MLRDALEERYLAYALSTIMHRALPDARDGLKPVHRRILYGMRLLRLDPGTPFKKSAKIVGDVMARSIRMATSRSTTRWCAGQDFGSRYPLSYGTAIRISTAIIAAAYRATPTARMTEVDRLVAMRWKRAHHVADDFGGFLERRCRGPAATAAYRRGCGGAPASARHGRPAARGA